MIQLTEKPDPTSETVTRFLWLAIFVLVAAFFVADQHDWSLSRFEFYQAVDAAGYLDVSGGGLPYRVALVSIAAFGLFLIYRGGGRPLRFRGPMAFLITALLAWCVISWQWSAAPVLGAKQVVVLLACFVCALGICRRFSPRDLCLLALAVSGLFMAIGLCAELSLDTFRPWIDEHRFAGTIHPNIQSTYCAVVCLAAACLASDGKRRRPLWIALFVIGLIFLVLTKSRTSLAAILVALLILVMLCKSWRLKLSAAIGIPFAVCALALIVSLAGGDAGDQFTDAALMGRHEGAQSLTGRVPLWIELLGYAKQRPLRGYGYGSFWDKQHVQAVSDALTWHIPHAHSAYVDAMLSIGLIGAAMLIAVLITGMWQAAASYRTTGNVGYAFVFALLAYAAIHGMTESSFVQPTVIPCLAACGLLQLAFCLRETTPAGGNETIGLRFRDRTTACRLSTTSNRFIIWNRPHHN